MEEKPQEHSLFDHMPSKAKGAMFLQRKHERSHETLWSQDKLEVNEGHKTSSIHT